MGTGQPHTTYLGWVGVWSPLLSEADDDVDKPPVVQQPLVGASLWHLLLLLLLHLWSLAAHLTGTGKRTVNFTCGRDSQAKSEKVSKTKQKREWNIERKAFLSLSLERVKAWGKEGAREEDITPVPSVVVVGPSGPRQRRDRACVAVRPLSSTPPSNPPPRTRAQLGTKCLPMVCLSFPSASTRFASFSCAWPSLSSPRRPIFFHPSQVEIRSWGAGLRGGGRRREAVR